MALARNPNVYELADVALAYGHIGDEEEARRVFELAGGGNETRVPDLMWHFWMNMAVKDYESSLEYLGRAVDDNFPFSAARTLVQNAEHPDFDPIRADPRFRRLVEKVSEPRVPAGDS